jgi:hypothetical protein
MARKKVPAAKVSTRASGGKKAAPPPHGGRGGGSLTPPRTGVKRGNRHGAGKQVTVKKRRREVKDRAADTEVRSSPRKATASDAASGVRDSEEESPLQGRSTHTRFPLGRTEYRAATGCDEGDESEESEEEKEKEEEEEGESGAPAQHPHQHSDLDCSKSDGSDDSDSDDDDGSDDVDDVEENEEAEVEVVRRIRRPKGSTPKELKKDEQMSYQAIYAVQAALANIERGALQDSKDLICASYHKSIKDKIPPFPENWSEKVFSDAMLYNSKKELKNKSKIKAGTVFQR